jgi:hypothetical protein
MIVEHCDGCGKKLTEPYRVKIQLWHFGISFINKRIEREYCHKCFKKLRRLNNV